MMNPNKGPRFTVGGKPMPARSFLENQRVEATEEIATEEPKMNRAQRRAYMKQLKKAAKKRGAKW